MIWNNQNLLINKQSIFNKKIKVAGFVHLGDILSNDGKLKHRDVFEEKNLSLADYFLLLGVFSAIPPEWKLLKNGDDVNQTDKTVSDDDVKDITCMSSKSIYSALVKRVQIPNNISNILDWKNIYQLPGRVTLDTRTQAFQYKILNRILYTNGISYKMKLIPSPLCTFCGDHEESLEHLLVKCVYTKEFCSATTSWLNNHKLDEITNLFGCVNNNLDSNLLNHIIILRKYTIYICRNKNIKPSLTLLKAKTKQIRKLELFIAKKNKEEALQYRKWQEMLL